RTGTYSYAIGPFLRDRIRTPLQSIDPIPGTNAIVYHATSGQVNQPVPFTPTPPGTTADHTDSTIVVAGVPANQAIRDMTVNLTITHPRPDHLLIQLIAPDGVTTVTLSANHPTPTLSQPVGPNFLN